MESIVKEVKYFQPFLIIVIFFASAFSYQQVNDIKIENIQKTQTLLDIYSKRINTIIDGTIRVSEILEELIILHNGNAPIEEVKRLCKVLYDENIHITVSYAPDGIIEYSYPPEENEASIGHRLLEDSITKKDSIKAKESGVATLSKPYVLRQGSVAAVVRTPVFIKKDNKDVFWGFVAIAMRTSQGLITHSDIASIEKFGYEYHLVYYYDGEAVEILQSDGFDVNVSSYTNKFDTKYGTWELSLYHKSTFSEKIRTILSSVLFFLAFAYFIFYILYYLKNGLTKRKKLIK